MTRVRPRRPTRRLPVSMGRCGSAIGRRQRGVFLKLRPPAPTHARDRWMTPLLSLKHPDPSTPNRWTTSATPRGLEALGTGERNGTRAGSATRGLGLRQAALPGYSETFWKHSRNVKFRLAVVLVWARSHASDRLRALRGRKWSRSLRHQGRTACRSRARRHEQEPMTWVHFPHYDL